MSIILSNLKTILVVLGILAVGYFLFLRPGEAVTVSRQTQTDSSPVAGERTLTMITLLPQDGIPAIDAPRFYSAAQADQEYAPDELVLGVSIAGESKAYSTGLLSRHEIVNDTVGGRPIAVTW